MGCILAGANGNYQWRAITDAFMFIILDVI
jgi:hypothetical protein